MTAANKPDRLARRRFLSGLGAAVSCAAGGSILAQDNRPVQHEPTSAPIKPGTLLSRPIPSSGEQLPIMGLGTARTFNIEPGSAQMNQLREVLKRFHELGGTLVDSSPMYGHSEALTGMMAQQIDITDQLFFATKVWTEGRAAGERQMDTSAKHFQTDVIDLMQVHNLVDLKTQLQSVRERRDQGRIRYIGVSHYRDDMHDELADLLQREPVDFLQINYSIASRNIEQRLLGVAADKGVALIVNQTFERGRLFHQIGEAALPDWVAPFGITSWAQYLLKYVLSHPAVNVAIPATSKINHLEDNMQAALGPMPDAAARQRMAEHFDSII